VIGSCAKIKSKRAKSKNQYGFSLLELVIAMFIIIILISVALPSYFRSIQNARETVLKETLFQMNKVIQQYTADKGKMPKSVNDLVEAGYFESMPIDPVTEKAEWDESEKIDDPNDNDGGQGLKKVKSLAQGEDSSGKKYSEY
jgi:general secretion pathway protein G